MFNEDKVAIFIQARMSSTRLPGKVLMPLGDKSLLVRMVEQLSYSKYSNLIVVATSDDESDNPIEELCIKENILYFRGSLENVLDRFISCAEKYDVNVILRTYADCPLIDPILIDEMISLYRQNTSLEYICNTHIRGAIHGGGCELVSFNALKKTKEMITKLDKNEIKNFQEHVTNYIRENPAYFKLHYFLVDSRIARDDFFYTVDYKEDYRVVKELFDKLYNKNRPITIWMVLHYFLKNNHLSEINKHLHSSLPRR